MGWLGRIGACSFREEAKLYYIENREDRKMSASNYNLQYVGGFYPAGVVVAIQIKRAGHVADERLLNPADPADLAMLQQWSQQPVVTAQAQAQPVTVINRPLHRRELQALLLKAADHLPCCVLDWEEAKRRYAADSQIDWAVSQAI